MILCEWKQIRFHGDLFLIKRITETDPIWLKSERNSHLNTQARNILITRFSRTEILQGEENVNIGYFAKPENLYAMLMSCSSPIVSVDCDPSNF